MQEQILLYMHTIAGPALDTAAEIVTMAGEQVLFIAVISYIFWNVSKPAGYALTYTLMGSALLNGFLKLLFHTPRPFVVMEQIEGKRLATAEGFAFPSGHTQGAATFFVSMSLYLGVKRYLIPALLISLLVGLSRLYLGVHWPVDVIGGFILGVLAALLLYRKAVELFSGSPKVTLTVHLVTGCATAALLVIFLLLDAFGITEADTLYSMIKLLAITSGLALGSYGEQKQLDFTVSGSRGVRLIRYLIGLAGALVLLYGVKLLLPEAAVTTALRYFSAGLWAFYIYPLIGSRISIGSEGQHLFTAGGERV